MTSSESVRSVAVGPALQLAFAMAIAGTIGLFVKESGVGALEAVFWRCAIGAVVMLGYCALTIDLRHPFASRRDAALVAMGGVSIVVNWVLAFEAFRYISITLMTIVYHVQPFFVLALVRIAYGEAVGRHQVAWVALAFGGLVLAVGFDPGLAGDGTTVLTGVALTLVASLLYGAAVVAAKGIRGTRPEVVTLAHTLLGATVLAPLARPEIAHVADAQIAPWLFGLGVLHTGVVYVLMYGAYPHLTGPAIAVLTFVYPVTAIITDALVYRTPVGTAQIAGMGLIALATLAVQRGWRWRPSRAEDSRR